LRFGTGGLGGRFGRFFDDGPKVGLGLVAVALASDLVRDKDDRVDALFVDLAIDRDGDVAG